MYLIRQVYAHTFLNSSLKIGKIMSNHTITLEQACDTYHRQISTSPLFGQIIVNSSTVIGINAGKKIFNFAANGSNERQGLSDVYKYFADELAAGRRVQATMGAGDYGIDGRGLTQLFQNGSRGLVFSGIGPEVSRIGFVGSNKSGPDWRVAEFKPINKAIKPVVSITQAAGVATVNIVAHNASIGSTVRVFNADQEEYNGLHFVTSVIDADNFTFVVDSVTANPATGVMTCGIHDEYIHDFSISNMQFIDTNPLAHAGPTEETHGLGLFEIKGISILNTMSNGIGDETIELQNCEDFIVDGFRSSDTPSREQTGGGAISMKTGCSNGIISHFIIENTGSQSNLTYGINFKTVVHPEGINNIKVSDGFIINPVLSGIFFNVTSADIVDVNVSNVTISGGDYGVNSQGGVGTRKNIKLDRLTLKDQTIKGVNWSSSSNRTIDLEITNSYIDGRKYPDSASSSCIDVNGSRTKISNTTCLNSRTGITAGQESRFLEILNCKMVNIGAASTPATTFNQYVYDRDITKSGSINGLTIVDGKCLLIGIRSVDTVKNINVVGSTVNTANWMIKDSRIIEGCKGLKGNVQINKDKGSCLNNEFSHTASGTNGCIRINEKLNCIVSGNNAPNLISGNGIVEVAGSDFNIITGNNMSGRPVNLAGTNSITQGGNL